MESKRVAYTEISPSEFFYRNRDLAGFSNPSRALYATIRELVENSLDASECQGILPEVHVKITPADNRDSEPRLYTVEVTDNGPGVDSEHVPLAFGRVFYGSKFRLRQSRGMFGLGGTMAILYGQITSNKPVIITTHGDGTEHTYEMLINIQENIPHVLRRTETPAPEGRGLSVKVSLQGDYQRSSTKILEYIRQTALVSPYAEIVFTDPTGQVTLFERATTSMPPPPKETMPHPYGVDVEMIRRLIRSEKRKLYDGPLEELRHLLRKEVHISMKHLSSLHEMIEDALQKSKAGVGRLVNATELLDSASLSDDGRRMLADIVERWDVLSKKTRNVVSAMLIVGLDSRALDRVTLDRFDFARQKAFLSKDSPSPILPIDPFYSNLVGAAGGEPLEKFMCRHFHRVGENIARRFLDFAKFDPQKMTGTLSDEEVVELVDALHRFDGFLMPDASCLSPLGEEILTAGIVKELQPEFVTTSIRPPSAYSGFPFIVEVGLAYGGKILSSGLKLLRFANRIPLLYDEGSDVSWKVVNEEIDWRRYHVPQDAPLAIIVHICSTRVPYKTVGKEYLADRPELERELKNAVRDVLRKLKGHLSRKGSMEMVKRKMNIYGKYLPLIARFSEELAGASRPARYEKLLGRGKEVVVVAKQRTLEEFRSSSKG